MDRRRPGAHRHAAVPCVTPLVKVGVPVVWSMTTMQVDWQDLQDRGSLRLERREEIGPHEDVIEIVVQHVQVVFLHPRNVQRRAEADARRRLKRGGGEGG